MFCVACLDIWWRHGIGISIILWLSREWKELLKINRRIAQNWHKDGMSYDFSQLTVTFSFLCLKCCFMLSWYLQDVFLIGPIHQHKLRNGWDKFCHVLLCTKTILKNSKRVIFFRNATLTWCSIPLGQWCIF